MKNTLIILMLLLSIAANAGNNKIDKSKEAKEWIKNQPLEFIENKGQFMRTDGKAADEVLFKTSFGGCDIYITDKGLSYVFVKYEEAESPKTENEIDEKVLNKQKFGSREEENKKVSYYRLDMNLEGAKIEKANIIKENESKQGHYNYFYAHCPEGIYDVKAYGKITIKNIYKGIDWVIYTNSNSKEHPLKYDFVVHPEADYKDIKIKYLNAQSTSLSDNDSKLKIHTIAGNIEEGNLYSYQSNSHNEISSKYIIDKDSTISFDIANYDTTKTLVIDPLVWATYYGGSTSYDGFTSICSDTLEYIYITGYSSSTEFPTFQLQTAYWQSLNAGTYDVILLKFNKYGARIWSSYYGGSGQDWATSICIDQQQNIFVSGFAGTQDFPKQQLQGAYWQPNIGGYSDFFILKFNNIGIRQWATFYGGNQPDIDSYICVDNQNNLFLTGITRSTNIPLQQLNNAYWQSSNAGGMNDIVIVKFNNQGQIQWSTYYGDNGDDFPTSICSDNQNNIYIVGSTDSQNFPIQQMTGAYNQANNANINDYEAFILKFNNQGIRLWATFYGGSATDRANSICKDNFDNIYVIGSTTSYNFPLQQVIGGYWQNSNSGLSDAFIIKFNYQGIRLWSTYYGGNNEDIGNSIYIDQRKNIFITGSTKSTNLTTEYLQNEYWQPLNSGIKNSFICFFNEDFIIQWATYYGSNSDRDFGKGINVSKENNIYIIGENGGSGAFTIDNGNGAYYENTWKGFDDSYILKFKICYNKKPTILISNKNNICITDTGNIILTANGGMGDTLKWYSGGCGHTYIGKNTSITIPLPTQTTTYYARWESECDTSECDSITINVFQTNISNLYFSICQGDSVLIGQHIYKNSGNYIDTLSNINGCDSIVKTNLYVIPKIIINLKPTICDGDIYMVGNNLYSSTGIYTDTLISLSGCDSIVITNLTVNPLPIVDLGLDSEICNGETVELKINHGYTSYLWQDRSTNNNFIVNQPGLYWVIVNQNNCFKSDTVIYTKCRKPIDIWIPNAFTPTGDGLNEIFKIEKIGDISKFEMLIFNRWGQLIFESNNSNIGWDGKYQGKEQQSGVYTYRIYVKDGNNNQEKTYTGRVTLVR